MLTTSSRLLSILLTALFALTCAGCRSKSSSNSGELRTRSDDLTTEAIADVLSGNPDYVAIQGRLVEALAFNKDNVNARLMLGVVVAMAAAQNELSAGSQGDLLMQRAGLVNASSGGSLWDLGLEFEDHGQGLFKDTMPTIGELQNYFTDTVRPALEALVTVLDTIPTDWEYVIPAQNGGKLIELLAPGQSFDLRIDYGDVQLAVAAGNAAIALFDLSSAFDWNNLAPNDLDFIDNANLDLFEVIRTQYPSFGSLLNPPALPGARNRMQRAFQNFQNASTWIRAENAEQQAQGLITLGRDTFDTPLEMQTFLAAEAELQGLMDRVFTGSLSDVNVLLDIDPLTGQTLPLEEQVQVNLFRFLLGVDLRQLYFKTVIDPFTNKRALGVGSLGELTQTMATFQDVVASIGGMTPQPGDLQELLYSVRVDNVPPSTKIIDGLFLDWAADAVRVLDAPAAWLDQPAPDLGSLYVAVDSNYLYVYHDRDLATSLTTPGDQWRIEISTPSYDAWARYDRTATSYQFLTGSSAGAPGTPNVGLGGQGIEMRFPLSTVTGDWVELTRYVSSDSPTYNFESEPSPIYLKIR